MFYIIGSVCTAVLFILLAIYFIIKHFNNKEETKFLNLYNTLIKLKSTNISCKPTGRLNNSYSQGKNSYKDKITSLSNIIVNNIKIFSDSGSKNIKDYLVEVKKKLTALSKTFQIQIESIIKDKKDLVDNSGFGSIESIFSSTNKNDFDMTQKGVNCFDSIDNDINNLIDEIVINLINRYAVVKNQVSKANEDPPSFIVWLKRCLSWQRIIPIICSLVSSFLVGLLVNYISNLIF